MNTIAPQRAHKPALTGLFLSVFLAMLDAQVVATALPRIAAEFGGTWSFLALLPVLALALVTAFALPHVPLKTGESR